MTIALKQFDNIDIPNIIEFRPNAVEQPEKPAQKNRQGKKRGTKSEVYPFEIQDMKKLIAYFEEKEQWIMYLLFVLSCNMARRVGDMLALKWVNFFVPETGKYRKDILEIVEDKTDKLANPHINTAVKKAIELYIEKMDYDVSENNYQEPVLNS